MPLIVGLNSGTSADGVDAAVVRFDGAMPALPLEILAAEHVDYPPEIRALLQRLFTEWQAPLDALCHLPFAIGRVLADAARRALERAGADPRRVDVIGSHGQTIYHLPPAPALSRGLTPSTWQVGEAAVIADALGCPVASDFRTADIAAGGQGAPLTPILDHLLFTHPRLTRLRLNIGGIANLTWLPPAAASDQVRAFDTGPGNALIDETVRQMTGGAESCDTGGARARRGRVNEALLARMLTEPYFHQAPPKTTGRELFNAAWLARARACAPGIGDDDFLATVTALTAASIADAVQRHLPPQPIDELIVHGGGAKNPTLLEGLRARLPASTRITTVEEFGIPLQTLEPVLFALLGWLCLRRHAVFYPGATGARRAAVLGKLTWPASA